ncbi:MAG: hypothetical protein GF375_00570 [Candidatus Omnitrophica bacterium]|nr:hypothetical protein [Candidatus Omnitrophota bacterium]MBD3268652.1 hypothetical protein [Candidatus Omnitrophota bacterium]
MSCENKEKNLRFCKCTYPGCSRKGICCECIQYHLSLDELPGCLFPPEAEKTYNRSRDYYISLFKDK